MQEPPNILFVEDDEDLAVLLSKLLLRDGYVVDFCKTINEAVIRLRGGEFDLLISDIILEDGTGFDLIKEVRQHSQIPAIAMSGFGSKRDIQLSIASGFNVHLTKPVQLPELESAIQELLLRRIRRTSAN